MGRNPERDAREREKRMLRIQEVAFNVFARDTIERVTMQDVADECEIGIATLYRHYKSKPELVVAASTWAWEKFIGANNQKMDFSTLTAAEELEFYLETFINLYRNHRDILRFNQFFNIYVQSEKIDLEIMRPYMGMVKRLFLQFHGMWEKGERDGTLVRDLAEEEFITAVIRLMLAAVTRYAIGLVYKGQADPEKELVLLKDMLVKRFTVTQPTENK